MKTNAQVLKELIKVMNGRENASNTPDVVLADYLLDCLFSFEHAVNSRDRWHKHELDEDEISSLIGGTDD